MVDIRDHGGNYGGGRYRKGSKIRPYELKVTNAGNDGLLATHAVQMRSNYGSVCSNQTAQYLYYTSGTNSSEYQFFRMNKSTGVVTATSQTFYDNAVDGTSAVTFYPQAIYLDNARTTIYAIGDVGFRSGSSQSYDMYLYKYTYNETTHAMTRVGKAKLPYKQLLESAFVEDANGDVFVAFAHDSNKAITVLNAKTAALVWSVTGTSNGKTFLSNITYEPSSNTWLTAWNGGTIVRFNRSGQEILLKDFSNTGYVTVTKQLLDPNRIGVVFSSPTAGQPKTLIVDKNFNTIVGIATSMTDASGVWSLVPSSYQGEDCIIDPLSNSIYIGTVKLLAEGSAIKRAIPPLSTDTIFVVDTFIKDRLYVFGNTGRAYDVQDTFYEIL